MKKLNSIMLFLTLLVIFACKKETVSNPNIDEFNLDFVLENKNPTDEYIDYLKITNTGRPDFLFSVSHPSEDINQHSISLTVKNEDFEFLVYYPDDAIAIKNIEKDFDIKPISTFWEGNTILLYHYVLGTPSPYKYGFSDIGDQYIAFRKKNTSGGYNYGWMLVNIERGEKITIKEYALHKVADTPIKAGEK